MRNNIKIKDIAELLNDRNFIRLKKEYSEFNVFDVLRLKHHEIRHSNVLACLFKPQESHKFGSAFLEQFLLKLASCADAENAMQRETVNFALQMLAKGGMHVSVRREEQSKNKKRVDLQIECIPPSLDKGGFVILIENKIHSSQRDNQLADYLNHAEKEVGKKNPNIKIIPVYLTLDEDDTPSGARGEDYFHMTYGAVLEILETLTVTADSKHEECPSTLFVRDYIKTLKELLNMETEEQEYAKNIYRNYKDVIDFICASGENCITEAGKQFVEQEAASKVEAIDKGNAHFFPFTDSVLKDTEGGVGKDWRDGAVCGYFFQLGTNIGDDEFKGRLTFKIEVGPFEDSGKRQKLLSVLESKGIKYSKGSNGNSKYTRLSYKKLPGSKKITDMTNVEEVANRMKELFEETEEMREKLHDGINEWKKQSDINPDNGI